MAIKVRLVGSGTGEDDNDHTHGILAHMNADHIDSVILLAQAHARFEATEATMTSVDRLGFSLRLKTNEGMKGARINFPHEVVTPQQARAVLVEMVRQAKAGC